MDSVLLGTLIRLKLAAGCKGSVFPSHFISEAKLAIESQVGLVAEWYDLVDRLHFLKKRYNTFDEIVALEGTYWNATTNTVIVVAPNWPQALERKPLLGAYCRHGDPAYNQLNELFGQQDVKEEEENTVIVLSDSQSQGLVQAGQDMNAPPGVDNGEVSSNQPFSFARRKLMFGEGSPLDRESPNKKVVCYYVPDAKGKLEMKVEEDSPSHVLPRPLPPYSPTLAYSCASNSPRMLWSVLGKPNM
ncbi:hypothetical protein SASPL_135293 [Salvia splendens]|uniref:Myb/SANT-like domain-containing protein n=1 Tax=Salvia splendens TaxID=180675 RepID=A0A8X8ZFK0_SALSN|nr:hypothetical protein SASPL_135293 [Salvia splendens]